MKRVGIICGGFSSEFKISVLSATTIKNNLPEGYEGHLILLTRDGWFVKDGEHEILFNEKDFSFFIDGKEIKIDVAIVYIHGDPGENGKIQAYLELIGVPYVNSGPLASQLSFDKWYCNQFLKGFGINVAKSILLRTRNDVPSSESIIKELGLPVFVKPADSGSSFGIARVNKEEELLSAISNAFNEGKTVVIEAFLKGTEVTCGVFRSKEGVHALPLAEIVSHREFFDYEAKYQGLSEEITPARISQENTEKVQSVSTQIYKLLNLHSIARIDFMLVDDTPYVIEVNTTPGFSSESIVPKMLKAQNTSISEFWAKVLEAELN